MHKLNFTTVMNFVPNFAEQNRTITYMMHYELFRSVNLISECLKDFKLSRLPSNNRIHFKRNKETTASDSRTKNSPEIMQKLTFYLSTCRSLPGEWNRLPATNLTNAVTSFIAPKCMQP